MKREYQAKDSNMNKHDEDIKTMSAEKAIVDGLTELRDTMKSGQKLEERFTMRTVDLRLEPHDYEPDEIKAIRDELKVSQSVFAILLGVKPKTVMSWEQGLSPPPMARRLLDLMTEDMEKWKEILRNATKDKEAEAEHEPCENGT